MTKLFDKIIVFFKIIIASRLGRKWRPPDIKHGVPTKYGWIVLYPGNFTLGENVDIGYGCFFQAQYGIVIGDKVQIGGGCYFYSKSTIDNKSGKIIIHSGARIGAQSMVMPGVEIGSNSIVGAQSLVNRNVPANAVYFGTPVKMRRGMH